MNYNKTFIIIILISSISGIFFAILNNTIIVSDFDNKSKDTFLHKKNKENDFNKDYNYNEYEFKRNNSIPIAINIDNNYYLQAIVFLTSLIENIGPRTKYEIYILTSDKFEYKPKKSIYSLVIKYGIEKINIKFINMKNNFRNAVISEHITTAAYYRLLLSSMLPNVDKIIYCDCDIINFEDLSDMYNLELKDNIYYRGILDYFSHHNELFDFRVYSEMYLNSGILLINLKALKINEIEKEFIDICENHYLRHHDQTAINVVCSGHLEKLPIKYGIFKFESFSQLVKYNNEQSIKYRYSEDELKEGYYSPVNLHFAGFNKPWNHMNVKFEEYWWHYARKSDFYKEILYIMEYDNAMVDNIMKKIPKNGGFIRFK